jgi:hypothetical protein
MSSSCEMIFLTRATKDVLDLDTEVDVGVVWSVFGIAALALSRQGDTRRRTRQGHSACDLLRRSNWGVVVRHVGGVGW